MMKDRDYALSYRSIGQNPKFRALVDKRKRFAWALSAFVLLTWYCYMLIVAFAPAWLAAPIVSGGALSVGFPIGAAMVLVYWLLTGWYVRRANDEFDALNRDLLKEVGQ